MSKALNALSPYPANHTWALLLTIWAIIAKIYLAIILGGIFYMESKNLAIIGLVLGIVSIVLSFVLAGFAFIPLVIGIIGIVLSGKANKIEKTGIGTAGFILSIIGVVLSVIMLIVVLTCAAAVLGAVGGAAGLAGLAGGL